MRIRKQEFQGLDKYYRINLINQLSGVKGANLIGTKSVDGITNLAMFNSVIHIGANPASVGFLLRPLTVPRHTYSNIMETKYYTINQVRSSFLDAAHQTSAKYDEGVSEFDALGLTEEFSEDFVAPYVQESIVKYGVSFVEKHEIALNGTVLIVGQIEEIIVADDFLEQTGHLDLEGAKTVGVSGLDTYYSLKKIVKKEYARIPK